MPSRGLSKPNLGLSKPTWGLYRRSIEASSGDIRAIVAGVRSFSLQMLAPSRRRACKEFYDADSAGLSAIWGESSVILGFVGTLSGVVFAPSGVVFAP